MNAPQLKLVQPTPPVEETLRRLFLERDRIIASLATLDTLIADAAKVYASEQGLMMRPRLEAVRRQVGA